MAILHGLLVRNPLSCPLCPPIARSSPSSEYDIHSNVARTMDIVTNSFCAVSIIILHRSTREIRLTRSINVQGGNVLGNGTWMNVGGNQAVTYGGANAPSQNGGLPYDDPDGRNS